MRGGVCKGGIKREEKGYKLVYRDHNRKFNSLNLLKLKSAKCRCRWVPLEIRMVLKKYCPILC